VQQTGDITAVGFRLPGLGFHQQMAAVQEVDAVTEAGIIKISH
jgi:hypothetical protein